jgi:hypothetical protein
MKKNGERSHDAEAQTIDTETGKLDPTPVELTFRALKTCEYNWHTFTAKSMQAKSRARTERAAHVLRQIHDVMDWRN